MGSSHLNMEYYESKNLMVDNVVVKVILQSIRNYTSNSLKGGSVYNQVLFTYNYSFGITYWNLADAKSFYKEVPRNFSTIKEFEEYLDEIYKYKNNTSAEYTIRDIISKMTEDSLTV